MFGLAWWIGQAFGLIAFVGDTATFQVKTKRQILRVHTIACLAWVFCYALIGGYTAMALMILAGARIWGSYKLDKWSHHKQLVMLLLLLAIAGVITAVTWHGWPSMFALTGWSLMTLSAWSKRAQEARFFGVAMALSWLVYDVALLSIFGIMSQAVIVTSNVIALTRFRKHQVTRHALSKSVVHTRRR